VDSMITPPSGAFTVIVTLFACAVCALVMSVPLSTRQPQAERTKRAPSTLKPLDGTQESHRGDTSRTNQEYQNVLQTIATVVQALAALVSLGLTMYLIVYARKGWEAADKNAAAAKDSADIAARSLALANRGRLRIEVGAPFLGKHQSNFPYWLKCEGRTEIKTIRGQARFVAEMNYDVSQPRELQDERLNYERWTVPVPATTISPVAIGPRIFDGVASFPPVTSEALTLWDTNKPVLLFLNFDVWYVDAFHKTTPVHHLSMNFKWDRQSEGWQPNPFVQSRETDENEG
jgi:hypothetical protein